MLVLYVVVILVTLLGVFQVFSVDFVALLPPLRRNSGMLLKCTNKTHADVRNIKCMLKRTNLHAHKHERQKHSSVPTEAERSRTC